MSQCCGSPETDQTGGAGRGGINKGKQKKHKSSESETDGLIFEMARKTIMEELFDPIAQGRTKKHYSLVFS